MKVLFWGVRGSIPVPGPLTQRYGGNTSCIQVDVGAPVIILDSGTGIRRLGQKLAVQGNLDIHIFISHAHWDHIQGLPFFDPLYQAGNRVTFYSRHRDEFCLKDVIHKVIEDPYFPLSHEDWKATVQFVELQDGASVPLGPELEVFSSRLNHPLIANAYRVQHRDKSVVYVTDTAPFEHMILDREFIAKAPDLTVPVDPDVGEQLAAMRDSLLKLCQSADVVIYDTMFTDEEYQRNPHWGHSAASHAVEVCQKAGAKHLVIFHHAPERTDDQMDQLMEQIVQKFRTDSLEISPAVEGREIIVE